MKQAIYAHENITKYHEENWCRTKKCEDILSWYVSLNFIERKKIDNWNFWILTLRLMMNDVIVNFKLSSVIPASDIMDPIFNRVEKNNSGLKFWGTGWDSIIVMVLLFCINWCKIETSLKDIIFCVL